MTWSLSPIIDEQVHQHPPQSGVLRGANRSGVHFRLTYGNMSNNIMILKNTIFNGHSSLRTSTDNLYSGGLREIEQLNYTPWALFPINEADDLPHLSYARAPHISTYKTTQHTTPALKSTSGRLPTAPNKIGTTIPHSQLALNEYPFKRILMKCIKSRRLTQPA